MLDIESKNAYLDYCFNNYGKLNRDEIIYLLNIVKDIELGKRELKDIPLIIKKIAEQNNDDITAGLFTTQYDNVNKTWSRKITINDIIVEKFINKKDLYSFLSIINTLIHEIRHCEQHVLMFNPNHLKNPEVIIWYKEDLIREYLAEYFEINYRNLFCEIDARHNANELTLSYLKKYNNPKYIRFKRVLDIMYNGEKNFLYQTTHKNPKFNYGKDHNAVNQITHLYNEYIKSMPKKFIKDIYLKKRENEEPVISPLLAFEYNPNGTKKKYHELMRDRSDLIKLKRDALFNNDGNQNLNEELINEVYMINQYYKQIIESDKQLQIEALMAEMNDKLSKFDVNSKMYTAVKKYYLKNIKFKAIEIKEDQAKFINKWTVLKNHTINVFNNINAIYLELINDIVNINGQENVKHPVKIKRIYNTNNK